MERHFVEFFSPGTFCAETNVRSISSWDVDKALKMAKGITQRYNAKPYAFEFFTKGRTDEELDSHEINRSGTYYINGVIKTLDDIKAENDPSNKTLISNMECNGWDKIVQTMSPYQWTQPFEAGDQVVYLENYLED